MTSPVTPRPFRFGASVHEVHSATEWRDLVRRVEDLGYSTLFLSDHYLDRDLPEPAVMHVAPISAMAHAAAITSTLRIGCRVFCVDYHVPAALAKEAATLDFLSDGRLELGIGAGWSAGEYRAMGLTFDEAPRRVTKLEEVVALLKAHWSGEDLDLSGEFVNVHGYAGLPLPVQRPRPTLIIGGAKRRVLSLAAREADVVSFSNVPFLARNDAGLTPDEVALERVGFARDAAPERFPHLDLESSPYYGEITDDRAGAVERIAAHLGFPPEVVADHPNVLIGTHEEVADTLIERRERFGINYVTLSQPLLEGFAPVLARLAGT